MNFSKSKKKGGGSISSLEQRHMDEQVVVGGNEGATLTDMVGLNMGLVQLWMKSKANRNSK